MRKPTVAVLLVLAAAACAPGRAAPDAGAHSGRVGVLLPVKGRCPKVVVGTEARRVCVPRVPKTESADTAAGARAASGGPR